MKIPPKRNHKCKVEVNLKCIQDVQDMISDLRTTLAKAKRTGGEYVVGRENFDGEKVIFNISIPHEECS